MLGGYLGIVEEEDGDGDGDAGDVCFFDVFLCLPSGFYWSGFLVLDFE